MLNSCKNCSNTFEGEHCNACGQNLISRFTGQYLWKGLQRDMLEVDNGLLLTFKSLWINPGKMVLQYINGTTKRYYSPLKYLIFWTAVYLVVESLVNVHNQVSIPELILKNSPPFSSQALLDFLAATDQFMKLNTNFYFLGLIPFLSLATFWFYQNMPYNLTEIVILFTFFCGQVSSFIIAFVFLAPAIEIFKNYPMAVIFGMMVPYSYLFFKMQKQFFGLDWGTTFLRGLGSLSVGTLMYWVVLFVLFNVIKYFGA